MSYSSSFWLYVVLILSNGWHCAFSGFGSLIGAVYNSERQGWKTFNPGSHTWHSSITIVAWAKQTPSPRNDRILKRTTGPCDAKEGVKRGAFQHSTASRLLRSVKGKKESKNAKPGLKGPRGDNYSEAAKPRKAADGFYGANTSVDSLIGTAADAATGVKVTRLTGVKDTVGLGAKRSVKQASWIRDASVRYRSAIPGIGTLFGLLEPNKLAYHIAPIGILFMVTRVTAKLDFSRRGVRNAVKVAFIGHFLLSQWLLWSLRRRIAAEKDYRPLNKDFSILSVLMGKNALKPDKNEASNVMEYDFKQVDQLQSTLFTESMIICCLFAFRLYNQAIWYMGSNMLNLWRSHIALVYIYGMKDEVKYPFIRRPFQSGLMSVLSSLMGANGHSKTSNSSPLQDLFLRALSPGNGGNDLIGSTRSANIGSFNSFSSVLEDMIVTPKAPKELTDTLNEEFDVEDLEELNDESHSLTSQVQDSASAAGGFTGSNGEGEGEGAGGPYQDVEANGEDQDQEEEGGINGTSTYPTVEREKSQAVPESAVSRLDELARQLEDTLDSIEHSEGR